MSTPPSTSNSAPPPTTTQDDAIPLPKPKPEFKLPSASSESSNLLTRLQSFLPQLAEANAQLEVERKLGILHKRRIEVEEKTSDDDEDDDEDSDSDSDSDDSSDEDSDDEDAEHRYEGEEKAPKKPRKQYIEMNLGLGVLEELPKDADGNTEIRTKEDSDVEMDDGATVLDRLKGQKGKGVVRPTIEVVEDAPGRHS
ncbi:hypothetical protein BJ508DRAFT_415209 [Ascobolus immersus RN42]|uniref:Uncharacterized protein n=1 Tax=Ascobolus immersus RN42 TaxID=1160509 RepID=A0A3N4I3N9_ASCIM|nr:hypothetical protein BJ508DRAFT_415209 [Ascobolus immersus RN42]